MKFKFLLLTFFLSFSSLWAAANSEIKEYETLSFSEKHPFKGTQIGSLTLQAEKELRPLFYERLKRLGGNGYTVYPFAIFESDKACKLEMKLVMTSYQENPMIKIKIINGEYVGYLSLSYNDFVGINNENTTLYDESTINGFSRGDRYFGFFMKVESGEFSSFRADELDLSLKNPFEGPYVNQVLCNNLKLKSNNHAEDVSSNVNNSNREIAKENSFYAYSSRKIANRNSTVVEN